MATTIVTVDDLDGSPNARPVTFSILDSEYEIDLVESNVEKLRDALAPFIVKARKLPKAKPAKARSSAGSESKSVREWAAQNGHSVPNRGRVPQAVVDAYRAAN